MKISGFSVLKGSDSPSKHHIGFEAVEKLPKSSDGTGGVGVELSQGEKIRIEGFSVQ